MYNIIRRIGIIPNAKPVTDLRNYDEVLRDAAEGEPDY